MGTLFFLLSIFDAYTWVYHPFQRNILVDIEMKSEEEQIQLKQASRNDSLVSNSSSYMRDSQKNIYDMIVQASNSMQGNGFTRPFEVREFRHLLISSFLYQTGIFVSYYIYLYDEPKSDIPAE